MTEQSNLNISPKVSQIASLLRDLGGVVLVGMMFMTVFDIFGRAVGLGSIEAVVELTSLGVVIVASFGLAMVTVQEDHIFIDLFTTKNRPVTNDRIDSFWLLIMGILLTTIAYLAIREGLIAHGDGTTTEVLEWSILSFHLPPVVGWAFTAFVAFWIGITVLRHGKRHNQSDDPEVEVEKEDNT
jgi:TRAP-type transport system small permease protein